MSSITLRLLPRRRDDNDDSIWTLALLLQYQAGVSRGLFGLITLLLHSVPRRPQHELYTSCCHLSCKYCYSGCRCNVGNQHDTYSALRFFSFIFPNSNVTSNIRRRYTTFMIKSLQSSTTFNTVAYHTLTTFKHAFIQSLITGRRLTTYPSIMRCAYKQTF